ncbi:MAG: DNA polymerase III subunit delta [Defluviitaleaceae bacterium]|nr:DNA polymerase III subunit delta [Defluviitaleaceae bacterium]
MPQRNLKDEIAKSNIQSLYVLFGEERFLVNHYAHEIEKKLGAKILFDGAVPVSEIIMAAETLPFFGATEERRMLLVRESKLFASGRKDDSEKMADYLPKIPPDTTLVFVETEIDRRTRIFKKANELNAMFECTPLSPSDLNKWVTKLAKGKQMPSAVVHHFLRVVGSGDMTNINNEAKKLISFCGGKHEITINDINEICTPTLESRIFDLTKAMSAGKTAAALKMYSDMLTLKESPLMILSMIIRQIRIMLLCKCLAEKTMGVASIVGQLKLRDFMVAEALGHGKRFSKERLVKALEDCLDIDVRIKTGLIGAEVGVELLLVNL